MYTFDGFFDHLADLDWLAVLLGTVVLVAAGTLWYGPLFGRPWSKAVGVKMEATPQPAKVIATVVYSFVVNVGISFFSVPDGTVEHAAVAAVIFGLLLIAPALYSAVVWAAKSLTAVVIDALWWIAAVFLAVLVQGLLL